MNFTTSTRSEQECAHEREREERERDLGKIVRRHFDRDLVTGKDLDVVLSNFARNMCQNVL